MAFRLALLTLSLLAPFTAGFQAARLPCRAAAAGERGRWALASLGEGGEGEGGEEEEEATVYKRKKGGYVKRPVDDRDRLPYELTDVTPPERRLGTYRLAPNLGCGDMVETSEDAFVVKRVSYRYAYRAGRYRMVGKGANVVKAGRFGIEKARRAPDSPLARQPHLSLHTCVPVLSLVRRSAGCCPSPAGKAMATQTADPTGSAIMWRTVLEP